MSETPELELRNEAGWVRRPWCVWLAVILVVLGAISNTFYLWHNCPLDLSGDESHYWEWSRHLDFGYYSKPPGIAWVIWLAVRVGAVLGINGDGSGAALMPVIRMPAVFFGLLSGLISLSLTRRIFRDDRAALAVIVLSAAVPMFAVGSLLITIDSPMYLCWGASVYCLWRAVEGNTKPRRGTLWLYAAGLACATGMMFKPVLIAVPICVVVAALADVELRRTFRTWHSVGALLVVSLSQVPTILWNAQHEWVTFRHIATQGGLNSVGTGSKPWILAMPSRVGEYIGGQAGGFGGLMFGLLVIAAVLAWQSAKKAKAVETSGQYPSERARWVFLLSFALPLWLFYLILNFWTGTELNWPAASYFAGMILAAGIFVRGWNSTDPKSRRSWRTWGIITVGWGFVLTMIGMNLTAFYPVAAAHLEPLKGTRQYTKSLFFPRGKWDIPLPKLRTFQEQAAIVQAQINAVRQETGMEPLIITTKYDASSYLSFYLPGHPFVYCIMSNVGGRHNQYDLWPGLNQTNASGHLAFAGRPAVIVIISTDEKLAMDVITPSFDHAERQAPIPLVYRGITIQNMVIVHAYGFKGLPASSSIKY